jgi:hypothetical protein
MVQVRVEPAVAGAFLEKAAVFVLAFEQRLPAFGDDGSERLLAVAHGRVAGALEGEQSHGGGGVGVLGVGAVGVFAGEAPEALAPLIAREPAKGFADGALGGAGAAVGAEERVLHAGGAAEKGGFYGGDFGDRFKAERGDRGRLGGNARCVGAFELERLDRVAGIHRRLVERERHVEIAGGDVLAAGVVDAEAQDEFGDVVGGDHPQAKDDDQQHVDDGADEPGGGGVEVVASAGERGEVAGGGG